MLWLCCHGAHHAGIGHYCFWKQVDIESFIPQLAKPTFAVHAANLPLSNAHLPIQCNSSIFIRWPTNDRRTADGKTSRMSQITQRVALFLSDVLVHFPTDNVLYLIQRECSTQQANNHHQEASYSKTKFSAIEISILSFRIDRNAPSASPPYLISHFLDALAAWRIWSILSLTPCQISIAKGS